MLKQSLCLMSSLLVPSLPVTGHAIQYQRLLEIPLDAPLADGIAAIKAVVAKRSWDLVSVHEDAVLPGSARMISMANWNLKSSMATSG